MKNILLFLLSATASFGQTVIIWTMGDGSIQITRPVWSAQRSNETTAAFLDRVQTKVGRSIIGGTATRGDESNIPKDRYFRDSWVMQNGTIQNNRARAEAIHKNRLKGRIRNAMQQGTFSIRQAMSVEDSVDSMDLTTATSLQDLKAMQPIELKGIGSP